MPTGFIFAGWRVGTPEGLTSYCVGENEQVLQSGTSYTVNADVSLTARYIGINISLANDASNYETLHYYNGKIAQTVTLADRTLYKDGAWNTLCLPFDVDNFSDTPLEGATVKTLASSDFNNGTLTLNFSDAVGGDLQSPTIQAGKPYIVTTVGIGTVRKQLAHFRLKEEATLVDGQCRHAAAAADDFAIHRGDAFAKNRNPITFHLVACDEVAISGEKPIGFGLVDKTTTYRMIDAI